MRKTDTSIHHKKGLPSSFPYLVLLGLLLPIAIGSLSLYAKESARAYRNRIFKCIVSTPPYEYMFANQEDPSAKTIELFGRRFGEFTAGTQGAMFYSGFMQCIDVVDELNLGDRLPWGSLAPLEHKTKLQAAVRSGPFLSISPLIIRAAARIYIPEPSEKLDGKTIQKIYDIVFRRGARLMTESYLHISNTQYTKEQLSFIQAWLGTSNFDAEKYLAKRYGRLLGQYRYNKGRSWGLLQPEHAFGFWIRRGLDGSAKTIWQELSRIMQKYDGKWFASVRRRYSSQ